MKINNDKKPELTYEIICAAVNGNEEAGEIIFDYYEPYIIKLSKIPYINDEGQVKYIIDEDIYMDIKVKLQKLILGFQVV